MSNLVNDGTSYGSFICSTCGKRYFKHWKDKMPYLHGEIIYTCLSGHPEQHTEAAIAATILYLASEENQNE